MSEKELKAQILELQEQVRRRDEELTRFRGELSKTNQILETMIAEMAQDLRIAALIQRVLSPTELPNINGVEFSTKFLAGTESGGDYFDVFEHEDKLKFGIVVASSSGYAMSALFLSVLIQMSSRIEARKGLSPDVVLQQMAQEIVPNVHDKDQAHIFYAVMDRRNFELSFSACGPIAAFHHNEEADTWARLEPASPALSKSFTAMPLKQSLIMGPRDRLVLCTQGVMSAKNAEGEEFGAERLLKCLKLAPKAGVHDVRNEVLYQVEKFSGLAEPFRDQTVVVMEVKDRVIKLAKR
ncbi:MAG: SpoIIE family protein phosphatase [Bdellovibrionaceae bacterium]|nr:SpoIIE family protein phosphatase [Pseudobdellovibrionaceae bacterium]